MRKIGVDGGSDLPDTCAHQIAHMPRRSKVNLALLTGFFFGQVVVFSDTIASRLNTENASVVQELSALRSSAQTPEERISAIEEWLKLHPRPTVVQRSKGSSERFSLRTPVTEDEALKRDILQGLKDTRALAKNPQEKVALIAEFQRLNADALKSVKPLPLEAEKLKQLKQYAITKSQIRLAAQPESQLLKIDLALKQIRAEAKSLEERANLTAQLLESNRKSIAKNSNESSIQTPKSNDE